MDNSAPQRSGKLRVGFGVTLLGRGRFNLRSRTGLFRVASELVRALDKTVELHPWASRCRGEAEEVLQSLGLDLFVRRGHLERRLYPLLRSLLPEDAVDRGLSVRTRKRFRTGIEILERLPGGHPSDLKNSVDLLHSPYDPFSEEGLGKTLPPRVITVHDLLPLTHPEYFRGKYNYVSLGRIVDDVKRGAWAHCISRYTEERLKEMVPRAKCFVAPLAADKRKFSPPTEQAVAAVREQIGLHDDPYILTLGSKEPRKNIELIKRIFPSLIKRVPNLKWVIAGPSPLKERHESILNAGFVADSSLAALYGGANVFLFPSWAEGFGLPILEAMQCGVPVIAAKTTSLAEVGGEAATLLPPNDDLAWIASIIDHSTDKALVDEKRALSLQRASCFSWSKTASALVQGYLAALS